MAVNITSAIAPGRNVPGLAAQVAERSAEQSSGAVGCWSFDAVEELRDGGYAWARPLRRRGMTVFPPRDVQHFAAAGAGVSPLYDRWRTRSPNSLACLSCRHARLGNPLEHGLGAVPTSCSAPRRLSAGYTTVRSGAGGGLADVPPVRRVLRAPDRRSPPLPSMVQPRGAPSRRAAPRVRCSHPALEAAIRGIVSDEAPSALLDRGWVAYDTPRGSGQHLIPPPPGRRKGPDALEAPGTGGLGYIAS